MLSFVKSQLVSWSHRTRTPSPSVIKTFQSTLRGTIFFAAKYQGLVSSWFFEILTRNRNNARNLRGADADFSVSISVPVKSGTADEDREDTDNASQINCKSANQRELGKVVRFRDSLCSGVVRLIENEMPGFIMYDTIANFPPNN